MLDNTAMLDTATPPVQPRALVRPDNRVGMWHSPAVIAENNFIYKSLSNWAFNVAVGCSHACRFCYVPSAATIKQGPKLVEYGVKDPDAEWGAYVLLRLWDEKKFLMANEPKPYDEQVFAELRLAAADGVKGRHGEVRKGALLEADVIRQTGAELDRDDRKVGVLRVPGAHAGDAVARLELLRAGAALEDDAGVLIAERPRVPCRGGGRPARLGDAAEFRAGADERGMHFDPHGPSSKRRHRLCDDQGVTGGIQRADVADLGHGGSFQPGFTI